MIIYRIISLLIGYIFGNISVSLLLGKKNNVDLQKTGSGNIGSTNTMRVLGKKAGAIVLVCDCFKCIIAVGLAYLIFRERAGEQVILCQAYAALGAILGHDFPALLKFKGGKGVACTVGMIAVIYPQLFFIIAAYFIIIVLITKYVSLGSCTGAIVLVLLVIFFGRHELLPYSADLLPELYVIVTIEAILVLFLHRANIKRLISGNENKFSFSGK